MSIKKEYFTSKDVLQLLNISQLTLNIRLLKGTIPVPDNEEIRTQKAGRLWEKQKFLKWMENQ